LRIFELNFEKSVCDLGGFIRWDSDKDDKVTLDEFAHGLRSLGIDIPNDRAISALMQELDTGLLLNLNLQ
jgi:Ca2+-binding EF-hand superfamily protein